MSKQIEEQGLEIDIHEMFRDFAERNGLMYDWTIEKKMECIVFRFYNPSKKLEYKKYVSLITLQAAPFCSYWFNEITNEARSVL